jgi:hypothetical protein
MIKAGMSVFGWEWLFENILFVQHDRCNTSFAVLEAMQQLRIGASSPRDSNSLTPAKRQLTKVV